MNIVTDVSEWQAIRRSLAGQTIGFVPTMGHLHEGHLSLCERARSENQVTIVSVFVNPTQFNQAKDFDLYPRTAASDQALLKEAKVDYVLMPSAQAMYPDHFEVRISEYQISNELEGEFRPGHFTGMLTIVLKLLNLVMPSRAYFGEKDYQQLLLVEKMVKALFLPIEIVPCVTVRADDGLALSSRNSRLSHAQRLLAANFARLLQSTLACGDVKAELERLGFAVDYIVEQWGRRLGAVWLDDVRLIDNVKL